MLLKMGIPIFIFELYNGEAMECGQELALSIFRCCCIYCIDDKFFVRPYNCLIAQSLYYCIAQGTLPFLRMVF